LVKAAAADLKTSDATDIKQMRQPLLMLRCLGEQAVLNAEFGVGKVGGEDADLVVDEGTVADLQLAAFEPNPGAVAVRHAGTAEFDVVDAEVAVADDPDRFTLGVFTVRDQDWPLSDAADGEVILIPDGNISPIFTRHDFNGIAVFCKASGIGDVGDGLIGADAQDRCLDGLR